MDGRPRIALVTGAGGGMAAGINRRLANDGHVIICVDRDGEAARRAADALRGSGAAAQSITSDLREDAQLAGIATEVAERWGGVDILVNAMGMLDRRPLGEMDDASFAQALEANLAAPARVIRAVLPGMTQRGWGRIINISSMAATTGYAFPAYAAAKAGLSNLTRSLVIELWGSGVTVNSVSPGVVDTPMVTDAVRQTLADKIPTGRAIDVDEVGALVAFLASDDARSINGAELLIDGGASTHFRI